MILITEANSIIREELEQLKKNIIEHHLHAGQKASGRTADSLRVELKSGEGILWGRSFFDVLETGRKGGHVPYNFQDIIREWLNNKGIKANPIPYKTDRPHKYTAQERGDMSLSYFIARKIKRDGTKLFRVGGRADIYSNEVPQAIERVKTRIAGALKVEAENIKINNIEV